MQRRFITSPARAGSAMWSILVCAYSEFPICIMIGEKPAEMIARDDGVQIRQFVGE